MNYRMQISRDNVLKLLVRCRMTFNNQEQLVELLETDCLDNETIEEDLFLTLTELYKGTSNGYLSEIYEAITGEKVEVRGKVDELFKCPCCHRNTLSESYDSEKGTGYDICDYCNWEDDGTTEIDTHSGVNRGTISEYRQRIQENPNFYYKEKWYPIDVQKNNFTDSIPRGVGEHSFCVKFLTNDRWKDNSRGCYQL